MRVQKNLESSEEEKEKEKQERKSGYFHRMKSYKSLKQAIKAMLRWFGFGWFFSSKSSNNTSLKETTGASASSAVGTDRKIKMTTEELVVTRSRGIRGASRDKPPKPPIQSGKPGQIHSA